MELCLESLLGNYIAHASVLRKDEAAVDELFRIANLRMSPDEAAMRRIGQSDSITATAYYEAGRFAFPNGEIAIGVRKNVCIENEFPSYVVALAMIKHHFNQKFEPQLPRVVAMLRDRGKAIAMVTECYGVVDDEGCSHPQIWELFHHDERSCFQKAGKIIAADLEHLYPRHPSEKGPYRAAKEWAMESNELVIDNTF